MHRQFGSQRSLKAASRKTVSRGSIVLRELCDLFACSCHQNYFLRCDIPLYRNSNYVLLKFVRSPLTRRICNRIVDKGTYRADRFA